MGSLGGNARNGVSLRTILFNDLPITSLNFFDFTKVIGEGNDIIDIRKVVATWYYTLRNLAVVISLCVLIYTGVRMVMSSIAETKAKYKTMLMNWALRICINICTSIYNSWNNND